MKQSNTRSFLEAASIAGIPPGLPLLSPRLAFRALFTGGFFFAFDGADRAIKNLPLPALLFIGGKPAGRTSPSAPRFAGSLDRDTSPSSFCPVVSFFPTQ